MKLWIRCSRRWHSGFQFCEGGFTCAWQGRHCVCKSRHGCGKCTEVLRIGRVCVTYRKQWYSIRKGNVGQQEAAHIWENRGKASNGWLFTADLRSCRPAQKGRLPEQELLSVPVTSEGTEAVREAPSLSQHFRLKVAGVRQVPCYVNVCSNYPSSSALVGRGGDRGSKFLENLTPC